jgi:hypothetical protein
LRIPVGDREKGPLNRKILQNGGAQRSVHYNRKKDAAPAKDARNRPRQIFKNLPLRNGRFIHDLLN